MTDEVKQGLAFTEGPGIVVCVGNSLRGDDGAGPFIASHLKTGGNFSIIDAETTPENYVGDIISLNPSAVLFIDVADFGGAPGEARLIPREAISDFTLSTHSFPLGAICELIRQSIQTEIRFIGIQVKDCGFGEGLSEEVKGTAEEIVETLNKNK